MEIAVSFLKSKYSMIDTLKYIDASKADYIHVDLMDGVFVEELTPTKEIIDNLKDRIKPLEIHLMMTSESLSSMLPLIYKVKPKYIIIHCEIDHLDDFIDDIKKHNIKVGLAINPETSVSRLMPYLNFIDEVLVMSVNPGMGGQKFIENTIFKLQELKELQSQFKFIIAVDGGINNVTIKEVLPLANRVISGSYVCLSDDFNKKIDSLK